MMTAIGEKQPAGALALSTGEWIRDLSLDKMYRPVLLGGVEEGEWPSRHEVLMGPETYWKRPSRKRPSLANQCCPSAMHTFSAQYAAPGTPPDLPTPSGLAAVFSSHSA